MKIAIQGHPTRGKEVIQILESLGGINKEGLTGTYETFYYIDDKNEIGDDHKKNFPPTYKLYNLEEFEKEFPFKIGDKVIDHEGDVAIITGFAHIEEKLGYSLQYKNGRGTATSGILKLYKEMKEERNIILTLDKAKEWYNKGGELKEIALQAYSEEELNHLPRSWEEFCKKHPIKEGESYINSAGKILSFTTKTTRRDWDHICPSKKSAEAHLAMIQLEQLRNCWRQGWKPTPHQTVFTIKFAINGLGVYEYCSREFLSFKDRKTAKEFLECFRDLIEKAGDLI